MVVMDGLGGLPIEPGGKTELESAHKPNLDALAAQSILGLADPVGPGITPAAAGHLGLFGYDPLQYEIGAEFWRRSDRFQTWPRRCSSAREL